MSQIESNVSLKKYNTFGIDCTAQFFAKFNSVEDLKAIIEAKKTNELLPIGGGSNILFTKDFKGLVLKNEIKGIELTNEDEQYYYIKAGSGEIWHQFVLYCIANNYAGVENLSLIPGCVGASPMQNIGAYGIEIKDVFHSLEALHIKDLRIDSFTLSDCHFGYRESVFKNKYKAQYIITSVTYKLKKQPDFHISYGAIQQELDKMKIAQLSIKAISDAVIAIRQSKLPDPKFMGNAGSFFKNPIISNETFLKIKGEFPNLPGYPADDQYTKVAAGWLIDQSGLKGFKNGNVGVHDKQALVLVNLSHATGKEIFDLSTYVIETVQKKFGITLEREVNII